MNNIFSSPDFFTHNGVWKQYKADTGGSMKYDNFINWLHEYLQKNYYNTGDYAGAQGFLAGNNISMSPEYTQWMNNMISNQRTLESRGWESSMRDTELLSTAQQLSKLGLNPASTISMGRSQVPDTGAAYVDSSNPAQQKLLQENQQKAQMARAVLGLIGGMASAGIGGASIGLARGIGSKIATSYVTGLQDQLQMLNRQNDRYRQAFMNLGAAMTLNR